MAEMLKPRLGSLGEDLELDELPNRSISLQKRSSISNLTGLLRMGKTRSNRSLTLLQVHKRLQVFDENYKNFLTTVCKTLTISPEMIFAMQSSEHGKQLLELLTSSESTDLNRFLSVLCPQIQLVVGSNNQILQTILQTSHTLHRLCKEQSIQAISLVETLRTICQSLMKAKHLAYDTHSTQIISWWLPQFVEMLCVLLLISEPTKDGSTQQLKDTKTLESYFSLYQANLVIVIYLLSGEYLFDLKIVDRVLNLQRDFSQREKDCLDSLQMKTSQITSSIRKRLRCTFKDSLGDRLKCPLDSKDSLAKNSKVDSQVEQIKQWKDIYHSLPPVCCHSIYLFLLHMPSDLCDHFSINIPTPTSLTSSQLIAQSNPLLALLDRVLKIGEVLEAIRATWPIIFTEADKQALIRTILVVCVEAKKLHKLESIPFVVPESWDNWLLYLELLEDFIDHMIILVQRQASLCEAETLLGKMIVQTRFLTQISRIEADEECIFYSF